MVIQDSTVYQYHWNLHQNWKFQTTCRRTTLLILLTRVLITNAYTKVISWFCILAVTSCTPPIYSVQKVSHWSKSFPDEKQQKTGDLILLGEWFEPTSYNKPYSTQKLYLLKRTIDVNLSKGFAIYVTRFCTNWFVVNYSFVQNWRCYQYKFIGHTVNVLYSVKWTLPVRWQTPWWIQRVQRNISYRFVIHFCSFLTNVCLFWGEYSIRMCWGASILAEAFI